MAVTTTKKQLSIVNNKTLTSKSLMVIKHDRIKDQEGKFKNVFADAKGGQCQFSWGDNWKAYAADFPIGTKIIETTTVEVMLPEVYDGV